MLEDDLAHGEDEERFLALGRTDMNRRLFLAFSLRDRFIRVISARDMTNNERAAYETHKQGPQVLITRRGTGVLQKRTDSTELVDRSKVTAVTFPNLKPTVRSISIILPQSMIDELKVLANKQDVPYQSLMKLYLRERIDQELHAGT